MVIVWSTHQSHRIVNDVGGNSEGDGKTTSALRLASGLANSGKICVIDTENASASLYADQFKFDTLNLSAPFTDDKFVTGIKAAERKDTTSQSSTA